MLRQVEVKVSELDPGQPLIPYENERRFWSKDSA